MASPSRVRPCSSSSSSTSSKSSSPKKRRLLFENSSCPNRLLTALHVDCPSSSEPRSSTVPYGVVTGILSTSPPSLSELQETYPLILSLLNVADSTEIPISNLATAFGFLELLLETARSTNDKENERVPQHMILGLMQAVTDALCAQRRPGAPSSTLYCYRSLLRLDHYVRQSMPFLMPPLYLSLERLATDIVELQSLPPELLVETLLLIRNHLRDGLLDALPRLLVDDHKAQPPLDHRLHAKLFCFFLCRLARYGPWALGSAHYDSPLAAVLTDCVTLLACLIGLSPSSGDHWYTPVHHKAVKVGCALGQDHGAATWEALARVSQTSGLLETQVSTAMVPAALARGKAHLLLNLLDHNSGQWEVGLRISGDLVLVTLPWTILATEGGCEELLLRAMRTVTHFLNRASVGLATSSSSLLRFYGVLIDWLTAASREEEGNRNDDTLLPPPFNELASTVLYWHLKSSCDRVTTAPPLLTFLVMLLTHVQTGYFVRDGLVELFSLVLAPGAAPSAAVQQNALLNHTTDLLVQAWPSVREALPTTNGQRRKARPANDALYYRAPDASLLVSVYAMLRRSANGTNSCLQLRTEPSLSHHRLTTMVNSKRTPPWDPAVRWALEVLPTIETNVLETCTERFLSKVGSPDGSSSGTIRSSVVDCGRALIRRWSQQWVEPSSGLRSDRSIHLVLRLIHASINLSSDKSRDLMFAAIHFLGQIGKDLLIDPSSSQLVCEMYQRLLSAPAHWVVRTAAASAFVAFARTVAATHKAILPTCIPKDRTALIQCRIQQSVGERASKMMQSQLAGVLLQLHSSCPLDWPCLQRGILDSNATSTLVTIPPGSYFMTMPTQEGREVILIVPPGPEAWKDIPVDEGSESNPAIRTIARVRPLPQGGCTFSLQPKTDR
jgi:hypothetical protein